MKRRAVLLNKKATDVASILKQVEAFFPGFDGYQEYLLPEEEEYLFNLPLKEDEEPPTTTPNEYIGMALLAEKTIQWFKSKGIEVGYAIGKSTGDAFKMEKDLYDFKTRLPRGEVIGENLRVPECPGEHMAVAIFELDGKKIGAFGVNLDRSSVRSRANYFATSKADADFFIKKYKIRG